MTACYDYGLNRSQVARGNAESPRAYLRAEDDVRFPIAEPMPTAAQLDERLDASGAHESRIAGAARLEELHELYSRP